MDPSCQHLLSDVWEPDRILGHRSIKTVVHSTTHILYFTMPVAGRNAIPSPPASRPGSADHASNQSVKKAPAPDQDIHHSAKGDQHGKTGSDAEPVNCDAVRGAISNLIDESDMGVGDFQREISVTPSAYHNFMKQSGPERGVRCETYTRAREFFQSHPEMEALAAQHAPPLKRNKKENATQQQRQDEQRQGSSTSSNPGNKDGGGGGDGGGGHEKAKRALEVGDMKLDGEDECKVEVYDTCNEVRRKINTFLSKNNIPKAAFCRTLSTSYPDHREVPPRQLSRFLGKRGPTSGNSNIAFYAAYVFFEKKRLLEDKPKSKMRCEMEEVHPHGINVSQCMDNMHFIQGGGRRVVEDKYGRLTCK